MSLKDKIVNRIYNFLSNDRACSKCKHLKEERHILSILVSPAGMGERVRMSRKCSLNNSVIRENELDTRNCQYFKRKYGHAPASRKIRRFGDWGKEQWKLHNKIISLIVTVTIGIIAILVAKGLM